MIETRQRLATSTLFQGSEPGLGLISTRLRPNACLTVVIADDTVVRGEIGRVHGFHCLADSAMEHHTSGLEQTTVHHLAHAVVTEGEAALLLTKNPTTYQLFHAIHELMLLQSCGVFEDPQVEISSDHAGQVNQAPGARAEIRERSGRQGLHPFREVKHDMALGYAPVARG